MDENRFEEIRVHAIGAIERTTSSSGLYEVKVSILGKHGKVSELMREMGKLSKEDRPLFGKRVNELKEELEAAFSAKEEQLKRQEWEERVQSEELDLTLPGPKAFRGRLHPVTLVIQEIVSIFQRLGFSVRTGPLIESDDYNFKALNFPEDHPARDMQDTFFIDEHHVLRTHTSPIQIRTMESEKPPLRILAPGMVFRCDSDMSHLPQFHQIEGLWIDEKVSMANLKGTISFFARTFFDQSVKVRFRPSFFPFTEPSAEVDCSCPRCGGQGCRMCGHSGWIEIAGCGLVHPNVLSYCGIDPKKWQGYAFGLGIERMAIIKYNIEDIRLFMENDLRFLEQFRV